MGEVGKGGRGEGIKVLPSRGGWNPREGRGWRAASGHCHLFLRITFYGLRFTHHASRFTRYSLLVTYYSLSFTHLSPHTGAQTYGVPVDPKVLNDILQYLIFNHLDSYYFPQTITGSLNSDIDVLPSPIHLPTGSSNTLISNPWVFLTDIQSLSSARR